MGGTPEQEARPSRLRRRRDALRALALFAGAGLCAGPAAAATPRGLSGRPIRLPTAIVLHFGPDSGLPDLAPALAARMAALFAAPVLIRPAAPDLAEIALDRRGRHGALELLDRLGVRHGAEPPAGAFRALIVEGRLVAPDEGEVAATGWGDETTGQGRAVLGLAILDAARQGLSGRVRTLLTAERAFKHLATALVFTTGYVSVEPVMAQGLDGRAIDMAPDAPEPVDAAALREAGLLR